MKSSIRPVLLPAAIPLPTNPTDPIGGGTRSGNSNAGIAPTFVEARPKSNFFRYSIPTSSPYPQSQIQTQSSSSSTSQSQAQVQPQRSNNANVHPSSVAMGLRQHQAGPLVQQKAASRTALHPSMIDKLDPAFVKLYNEHIAQGPPPSTDINTVRATFSALYSYATAPATGVGGIGETTVPGWDKYPGDINVRVYVPPGEEPGQRKVWPVHFNFHGGGWAVGDLETSAHLCHHICATVPCCVIDIDYRLIPEYPFPVGIMDGLSAVAHILANHTTFSINPNVITFGGESTGATIALCLAHFFRDAGNSFSSRVKGIVVGTPSISDIRQYSTPEESPWESMRESEHMPILDWKKLKWFDTFKWMSLSPESPYAQPSASAIPRSQRPTSREMTRDVSWYSNLLNAPNFSNLGPLTWIGTAEIDPLRDEAEAYAEKVRENGNKVILKRYMGVPHPFVHMDGMLEQGKEYVRDVIAQIRACLYPEKSSKSDEEIKRDDNADSRPLNRTSEDEEMKD